MKLLHIKSLIVLFLMGGFFSPNQAALGKWDLSEAKVNEPECLNCCALPEFKHQCNFQAEQNYLYWFYILRSLYLAVPASDLAMSLMKSGRLHVWEYPLLATCAGLIFKNVHQIVQTMWEQRAQEVKEKPEGIILVVRAKEDWNYSLSSPYLAGLKKNHLVLYYTAEDISDIADAIKSVQSRFKVPIKALVWAAHGGVLPGRYGSETEIFFGSESISLSNIQNLNHVFRLLDKDCVIVVASCLSALGENSEVLSQGNIVQLIASVAEGRKVYASADMSTPFLDIDGDSLVPRFNSALSFPLFIVELLSFFTIDAERKLDLTRCYVSDPDGSIKRC